MHEEPAACVHEKAAIGVSVISLTRSDVTDLHFTRRKEVDAGDRLVANGDVSTDRIDSKAAEASEVVEEGLVWGAHSQLHLGELGHNTKVAHLVCHHN